jgi:type IV pilus assembly protein PilB
VDEPVKKKIGELLVDEGVITEAQLEIALAEQQRTGTKLSATLMALGLATEEEISNALGQQSGVQHVDLEQVRPTPEALALVAEELATEYELLPLRIEEDSLVVAMANPTDLVAIDRIQRYTDLFVRVVAAQRVQLRRATARAYERSGGEELEA